MRVTVFTSNQPRHLSLINNLANYVDELYAVSECTTLFPGAVKDYYAVSAIMEQYFGKVREAERHVFGDVEFTAKNVRSLPLYLGDLSRLGMDALAPALNADIYIVFGASFIKGDLCRFLVSKRALNIHMGTSPYYRGSSCNFWALYDNRPDFVGATIHLLTAGLDSGPILFHALPAPAEFDPFTLGMRAVRVAHEALCLKIASGDLWSGLPTPQDRNSEFRYTRNNAFTDEIAAEYLGRALSPLQIKERLVLRDLGKFIRPMLL